QPAASSTVAVAHPARNTSGTPTAIFSPAIVFSWTPTPTVLNFNGIWLPTGATRLDRGTTHVHPAAHPRHLSTAAAHPAHAPRLGHSRRSERVVGRKRLDEWFEQLARLLSRQDLGGIERDNFAQRGVVLPYILADHAALVVVRPDHVNAHLHQ